MKVSLSSKIVGADHRPKFAYESKLLESDVEQ
jgi:hypothetical protein